MRLTEYSKQHRCHVIKDGVKVSKCVKKLGAIEDRIEQGLLVDLPLKVGQIVYTTLFSEFGEGNEVVPLEVEEITLYYKSKMFKTRYCGENERLKPYGVNFEENEIGTEVYRTKEEAAAKIGGE